MTANIDPRNGIAYGYISASALDSELVNDLTTGQISGDFVPISQNAWRDERVATEDEFITLRGIPSDDVEAYLPDDFYEDYEPHEEECEGSHESVHYRTSWLGGALNFFILDSPCVTNSARVASPCVPNAGILDTLDGYVKAYNVPNDWREQEDAQEIEDRERASAFLVERAENGDGQALSLLTTQESVASLNEKFSADPAPKPDEASQGIDAINVRYFRRDDETNHESLEIGAHEFEERTSGDKQLFDIEYERHTVFENGCKQVCLTVVAL